MALRKLMELGNFQDKTTHAVTPSKEGVGGFAFVFQKACVWSALHSIASQVLKAPALEIIDFRFPWVLPPGVLLSNSFSRANLWMYQ